VPNGFPVTVEVNGSDQASNQTAAIIKEAYAEIGVEVTINAIDDATRSERFQAGDYEMSITPPGRFTSDVPIDDQFAVLLFNSPAINNLFTFYKNPEVGKLVREATRETDEDRRAELFEEVHVKAMENPPFVPIAYTPNRAAVRNEVHAFNYLLNGWWRLESVWKDADA
jgi:peptide/nickel transport system substrate-binding protein